MGLETGFGFFGHGLGLLIIEVLFDLIWIRNDENFFYCGEIIEFLWRIWRI